MDLNHNNSSKNIDIGLSVAVRLSKEDVKTFQLLMKDKSIKDYFGSCINNFKDINEFGDIDDFYYKYTKETTFAFKLNEDIKRKVKDLSKNLNISESNIYRYIVLKTINKDLMKLTSNNKTLKIDDILDEVTIKENTNKLIQIRLDKKTILNFKQIVALTSPKIFWENCINNFENIFKKKESNLFCFETNKDSERYSAVLTLETFSKLNQISERYNQTPTNIMKFLIIETINSSVNNLNNLVKDFEKSREKEALSKTDETNQAELKKQIRKDK